MPRPLGLVIQEEECLVLLNGPAHRAAELVQVEFFACGGEIAASVKLGVPEELKERAVKLVRPRLRGQQNRRTRTGSVFRRIVVGENLEFLDGVDRRKNGYTTSGQLVVVVTIKQPVCTLGA